jgi:nicotinamidase/pyrazinamidase
MEAFDYIQQKGENPAIDSYSAFRDNDQVATTGLSDYLARQGVTQLDVCGLATDYCVSFSVQDALDMLPGVKVRFIEDASRGIDPQGIKAAVAAMREKGAVILKSRDILRN